MGVISESILRLGEIVNITCSSRDIGHNTVEDKLLSKDCDSTSCITLDLLHTDSNARMCDCPKRQLPLPVPTKLPFPATEEHVMDLQQYLLNRYKSSTFNTCEHQTLPLMTGPPMPLMVDPEAKPVAYHTPVPVPLHWQEEVKAGLDQDVRLGVIEPVPIEGQVTWCHRMVVCAKKNGTPRHTVDFQVLKRSCRTKNTPYSGSIPPSTFSPEGYKKDSI